MGMAAILVMWPGSFEQFFVPPTPGGYIWNSVKIGPVVSEERSFEIVDGLRRTTAPAYTISSPGSDSHLVQQSRTILAILIESHPRNISLKLFWNQAIDWGEDIV